MLPRQPPIRLPYVVPGSLPGYAKQLVWVPGRHSDKLLSVLVSATTRIYPGKQPHKRSSQLVALSLVDNPQRILRHRRDAADWLTFYLNLIALASPAHVSTVRGPLS